MKLKLLLHLRIALSICATWYAGNSALALEMRADFDDLLAGPDHTDDGDGGGILQRGQAGGVGFDPADPWGVPTSGSTSTIHVLNTGNLTAPASTNFAITQSGSGHVLQGTAGAGRQNERDVSQPLTGEIWFSFLLNQPSSSSVGGVTWDRTGFSPTDPQVTALGQDLRLGIPGIGFVTDSSTSDLTLGADALILGRMMLDFDGTNDMVEVWLNPDVSAGPTGLGAPLLSNATQLSNWDSNGITQIGTPSYGDTGGSGILDLISFSDDVNAFEDVTGVSLGVEPLKITIDRADGSMTLSNPSLPGTGDIQFKGYTLTSGSESLAPANWVSIASNYDAESPGPSQLSPDTWTELTNANAHGDLSEFDFDIDNLGAALSPSQSVTLGNAEAWIASANEDLQFSYVLLDGSTIDGTVEYVGNGGNPFEIGDLDTDGDVDALDWAMFKGSVGSDFTSTLSITEAYRQGDLDGDLDVDGVDFSHFKLAYEAANGPGSFAALLTVPEPMSILLLALVLPMPLFRRSRNRGGRVALSFGLLVLAANPTAAVAGGFLMNGDFEDVPFDQQWDNTSAAPATATTGIAPGSSTAALIPGGDAGTSFFNRTEDVSEFERDFEIDFYFRVDGPFGSNRSLHTQLRAAGSSGSESVAMRVDPSGSLQLFTGSAWQTVGGGASFFQPNETYRIQLRGTNWGGDTNAATLGVAWSDAGSANFSNIGNLAGLDQGGFRFRPEGSTAALVPREFSEIRFLSAFQDASDPSFTVDDVTLDPLVLTLRVNTSTGSTKIVNDSTGLNFDIDLYEISSDLGELNASGWSSLEQQASASNFPGGDGTGNGWEVLGTPGGTLLSESYLLGSSILANDGEIDLGNALQMGSSGGLTFKYHLAGTTPGLRTGQVEVISSDADFDSDGDVDGLDFLAVQRGFGTVSGATRSDGDADGNGTVDQDDLLAWQMQYGSLTGPGSAVRGVPEPSGLCLLVACLPLLGSRHSGRRRSTC